MVHTLGFRRRTRKKFQKAFRYHGTIRISKHLTTYKKGDLVEILIDSSNHKGMPYKFYHGRTGRVFNVNPRSIGVTITKPVRNRIEIKKVHVRPEHLRLSTSRQPFIERVQANDKKKEEAKKQGKIISTKRVPIMPKESRFVKKKIVEFQNPLPHLEVY